MSDFEALLEELSEMVEDADEMLLNKNKIILEKDALMRIINGLNTHYPTEIARANSLLDEREKILIKARTDSERMLKDAQEKSTNMVNEQDIIKEAQRIAQEVRASADADAARIRKSAVEFADSVLKRAEDHYDQNLAIIKQARRVVNNQ